MSSKIEVALSAGTLAVLSLATIVFSASIAIATVSVHNAYKSKNSESHQPGVRTPRRPRGDIGPSYLGGTKESKEVMDEKYGPLNNDALKEEKHGILRNIAQRRQGSYSCRAAYSQWSGYSYQQSGSCRPTYQIASSAQNCGPTYIQPHRPSPCPCPPNITPNPNPVQPNPRVTPDTDLSPYTPYYPLLPEINSSCEEEQCNP